MASASRRMIERRRRRQLRRPRVFKDRSNPLEDLEEDEIFNRYRFRPQSIINLLSLLPNIARSTARNHPLPPLLQLLACLRFLATGAIHLLVGDSLNISRSAAGYCIRDVAEKICQLRQQFIKFPTGQQVSDTKNSFFRVAGFPNVLGCVDGTHIPIMRPKENEVDFVNRKSFHSLNCQMCCDSNFKITSCVATWPGSVHDSRIFRSSALCLQFENGDHDGFLLGDSGYCCRSFLLTPFLNAGSPAEQRYNDSLCRTRVIIEQTFGILKRRFQCLQKGLATDPKMASIYIVASVVLHNYGIERRDIIDIDRQQPAPQPSFQTPPNQQIANDGARMRKHIVDTFFSS